MTAKGNKAGTPFPARIDFNVAAAKRLARKGFSRAEVAARFHVSAGTLTNRGVRFLRPKGRPSLYKGKPLPKSLPFIEQARMLEAEGMSQSQIAKSIGKSRRFLYHHGIGRSISIQKPIERSRLQVAAEMFLYGATQRFIEKETGISRMTWRKYKPDWVCYLSNPKV